jgi:cell division septation protein DedD
VLIAAAGYPSESSAQTAAEKYAAALGASTQISVISDHGDPLVVPQDVTGLLLIAADQSKVNAALLEPIKTAWLGGVPLLADNGGAAVAGRFYSAHGPTPDDPGEAEQAVQKSFLQGTTQIAAGLGLLDITVEPQVMNDNRWGRLFSLAYNQPKLPSFGLAQNSALEVTRDGARVIGNNPLIALDLRNAVLDLGTNDGFVIANGLLDVFAPDDAVIPAPANVQAAPTRVPTPQLPTIAPTPTAAPTATPTSTATPAPTSSTPTSTPTTAPTATVTPEIVNVPTVTAVPASGGLALVPIAIGAGLVFFLIVLVAGRRRK